jgi:hypothetical protein
MVATNQKSGVRGQGSAETLSPLELHAIALAVAKQAAKSRDKLDCERGQEVDVSVRVHGTLDVQTGATYNVSKKPSLEDVLAVVLFTLTRAARAKMFETLVDHFERLASQLGPAAPEPDPELTAIPADAVDQAKDLIERMSRSETQDRRGAVTGQLQIERL